MNVHHAAAAGATERLKTLLAAGADANAQTEGGWTLLHYAAACAPTDTVALLLEHGAEANAQAECGRTAPSNPLPGVGKRTFASKDKGV